MIDHENMIVTSDQSNIQLNEDDACLEAKFLICDFAPNKNDVMLNRVTIDRWIATLVNQPVVGRITVNDDGKCDFEGHNFQIIKRVDQQGQVYEDTSFDTSAMGVFFDVSIEEIGGRESIVAHAKLWKRFPEFCALVKRRYAEGKLFTSWEIVVKEYHYETIQGRTIKVIDEGMFIGHALLNSAFPPAYQDSQLLEVASDQGEGQKEFYAAIALDLQNHSEKEEGELDQDKQVAEQDASVIEKNNSKFNADNSGQPLSCMELKQLVAEKHEVDIHNVNLVHVDSEQSEMGWLSVDDDQVAVSVAKIVRNEDGVSLEEYASKLLPVPLMQISELVAEKDDKIAELNEAITSASSTIQTLNSQIADLVPYKEKFEKVEQQRIESELKDQREQLSAYAIKSGYIDKDELASDETMKSLIDSVDRTGINAVIAERFMKSIEKNGEKEYAEKQDTAKRNIADGEDAGSINFVQRYIRAHN